MTPVHVAVVVDSDAWGGAEVWTRRVLEHLPAGSGQAWW